MRSGLEVLPWAMPDTLESLEAYTEGGSQIPQLSAELPNPGPCQLAKFKGILHSRMMTLCRSHREAVTHWWGPKAAGACEVVQGSPRSQQRMPEAGGAQEGQAENLRPCSNALRGWNGGTSFGLGSWTAPTLGFCGVKPRLPSIGEVSLFDSSPLASGFPAILARGYISCLPCS